MPEESRDSNESQFNLEGILSELGSFGKYQILLLLLLAFRDSFLSMCNYNYVFTAAEVAYRLVISTSITVHQVYLLHVCAQCVCELPYHRKIE